MASDLTWRRDHMHETCFKETLNTSNPSTPPDGGSRRAERPLVPGRWDGPSLDGHLLALKVYLLMITLNPNWISDLSRCRSHTFIPLSQFPNIWREAPVLLSECIVNEYVPKTLSARLSILLRHPSKTLYLHSLLVPPPDDPNETLKEGQGSSGTEGELWR